MPSRLEAEAELLPQWKAKLYRDNKKRLGSDEPNLTGFVEGWVRRNPNLLGSDEPSLVGRANQPCWFRQNLALLGSLKPSLAGFVETQTG
ncbi:hypothetical protein SLEP1_g40243 [Rubroshorea leprosula]|uniref:Uncharacterized protein n=1 Tax=Rubroshorea leprosula TaxID=152421 RepID=A0AAV5L2Z5_9ROSI|nr:hypothetical protein SLEP1_g40243 [Rubroshorea leprosula]